MRLVAYCYLCAARRLGLCLAVTCLPICVSCAVVIAWFGIANCCFCLCWCYCCCFCDLVLLGTCYCWLAVLVFGWVC